MGGCQNYGPLLGTLNIRCRNYYNRDPKRVHHFDNHPCVFGRDTGPGALAPEQRSIWMRVGIRSAYVVEDD